MNRYSPEAILRRQVMIKIRHAVGQGIYDFIHSQPELQTLCGTGASTQPCCPVFRGSSKNKHRDINELLKPMLPTDALTKRRPLMRGGTPLVRRPASPDEKPVDVMSILRQVLNHLQLYGIDATMTPENGVMVTLPAQFVQRALDQLLTRVRRNTSNLVCTQEFYTQLHQHMDVSTLERTLDQKVQLAVQGINLLLKAFATSSVVATHAAEMALQVSSRNPGAARLTAEQVAKVLVPDMQRLDSAAAAQLRFPLV